MTVVTLEEAKGRLEELANLAKGGESVWISQDEGAALELRPGALPVARGTRVPGLWAGKIQVGDEIFDPMPEEWLDEFYNGSIFPSEGMAKITKPTREG